MDTHLVGQSMAQIAAFNQSMAIAEFSVDGLLLNANGNYQSILGITTGFKAAKFHHQDFCLTELKDSQAYKTFWNTLCSGTSVSGIVERLKPDGSVCWLEATYAPVLNELAEVSQILKIATDITDRIQAERAQQNNLRMLSLVADASNTAVIISNADSLILYVNAGFSHLFGWTAKEAIHREPIALLSADYDHAMTEQYRQQLRNGHAVEREEILTGKFQQRFWVKVVSNPVHDAEGRWQYTVTTLTDITHAKLHETLQRKALEAMVSEKPLEEVLTIICREVELIAPELAASILRIDEDCCIQPLAAPSLPAHYCQALEGLPIGPSVGSCGTAAWRNEPVVVDDFDTDPLWENYKSLIIPLGYKGCWSTPVHNSRNEVIATFAFYFKQQRTTSATQFYQQLANICTHLCSLALEREQAKTKIRQLAFYDELTGLANRSLLTASTDQAILSCHQKQEPLAMLFIDLDRFKQVNDSLGHPAGDGLLQQVSTKIQQSIRPDDIAGRLSGDEFVVILPGASSTDASTIAERIQNALNQPASLADSGLSTSASIGIALYPENGHDTESLLLRADMAMYQAKSRGRGQYQFFSNELNELVQERLILETALRNAICNDQLELYYQPQIDLKTNCLYGVEALARWRHPEFGDISPTKFIPLAEDCGLIGDLSRWVLLQACKQLSAWRTAGLAVPSVSINLSPTNFHNLELPTLIAETLANHALSAQDLKVELTENVLLDTHPSTMQTIAQVHAQGIRLSMDDFGTGYSSLSYLRRIPVSELKLDRSFVADLEQDHTARAISSAVLGIGKSLQLTVVAEGIETQAQNALLQQQGYPIGQGYLFSKPLSVTHFEAWLHARCQP